MATMAPSAVQAFPSPLFPHPGLSSSTAAALAPGERVFFFFWTHWCMNVYPVANTLLHFCGSVLFSVTTFKNSAVSKSFGIPSQVVRTNPSLYFKLQACLYLLDPPRSTPQKSPPTRRLHLAGAATPQTPPTTWCPPLRPNRTPKSFRRRLLGGPPTFTRITRRPRWRGWYVPHSSKTKTPAAP